MNIPTAADAKAAALDAHTRNQQAKLDHQAALIADTIQARIADGKMFFSQTGFLPDYFRIQLEQKGYRCRQVHTGDHPFYTVEWETPLPIATP